MTTTQGTFDSALLESDERRALREAVGDLARRYGRAYFTSAVREGLPTDELWQEAGRLGYLGVNLPEEYGGGGGGLVELSLVLEELGAAGCPLLLMVVSPAICGTVLARFGTEPQKRRWLPGLADGSLRMAFGITEPDAGSNSHRITTTARRDPDTGGWLLTGRKVFVSGVDIADATLIVGRTEDARTGLPNPVCSSWSARRRASTSGGSRWNCPRRKSSSSSSWTTWHCPPTRWSATRTRG